MSPSLSPKTKSMYHTCITSNEWLCLGKIIRYQNNQLWMVKIEIMTVPQGFFLSASSIYREVLIWDYRRATSKHYSFDIFNTLLILLFNTLFIGSKTQEEHSTLSNPPPGQPFRLKLVHPLQITWGGVVGGGGGRRGLQGGLWKCSYS